MAQARKLLIVAAITMGWVSAPAQANSTARSELSFGKTQAILGGESRLAGILAQQEASRTESLRPASYSFGANASQLTSVRRVSTFSTDRPDVFGTVALKVGETSLDHRWRRVERSRISGRAAQYARSLRPLDEQRRIESVNRYVNQHVQFSDDARRFGQPDVWATANETLRRGRGDCEDYAVAKLQMLRKAGIADTNLYLVILKDLIRRSDHAVAIVRSGNEMLVLDNGTDAVVDSKEIGDYRPVLTFAANGTWTHGYKLSDAPVKIASAPPVARATLIPASNGLVHRSRSASLRALNTGLSK